MWTLLITTTQIPPSPPPPCRPTLCLKGPSNQLKIGQQDAYKLPIIATRGFRALRNSYGIARFAVGPRFGPILKSLRICQVIWFWVKWTLLVTIRPRCWPIRKIGSVRSKTYLYYIMCRNVIFCAKTTYWSRTTIKLIFEHYFRLSDNRSKRCFNLTVTRLASTLVIVTTLTPHVDPYMLDIEKSDSQMILQISSKSGARSKKIANHPFPKTPTSFERFGVGPPFRPIFKSLGIYYGIWYMVNSTFAVLFTPQELTIMENWLSTLEDLSIGYHFPKCQILCQNPFGFRTT